MIVVATGFWTTELADRRAHRRPRRAARWPRPGPTAGWRRTRARPCHGFPNLFLLVGPNTGQGHTSMVFIIESQVAYLRDAVRTMRSAPVRRRRAARGRRSGAGTPTCSAG